MTLNFNYCPNCGYALIHTALTSNPPILVVECSRCGWMMREGRSPSWNTASNSTEDIQINWQPQENITRAEYDFDSTPRVPPEHKMLKEEAQKIYREEIHNFCQQLSEMIMKADVPIVCTPPTKKEEEE